MENLLIVNYRNMGVGGIENYIKDVIHSAIKEKYSIIWLCDPNPIIDPIYEELLNSGSIKRIPCNTHGLHWFQHPEIDYSAFEKVIVLSFNFMDHIRGLALLKECGCAQKYPWLLIPHFEGGLIYPESNFHLLKIPVKSFCARIYRRFIDSGEMMFMSVNHPDALEESYGLTISQKERVLVPSFTAKRPFNEERIRRNYRQESFVIVSAGRLEFPHKGYLLGLIDAFVKLKGKYSFLKLKIIGDGINRDTLLEKLDSVNEEIRKDIDYCGMMPFEQLLDEYEKCNLSVSVAGCASAGAKLGLLTLPARHNTEKCEVYGFIPESKTKVTSQEPGESVERFIEQTIHMSEEEYVLRSRQSSESYSNRIITMDNFLRTALDKDCYYPSVWTIFISRCLTFLEKANSIIKIL